MPKQRITVVVPSKTGYVAPKGYRIVSTRELEDGTCEVTLEPLEFLS